MLTTPDQGEGRGRPRPTPSPATPTSEYPALQRHREAAMRNPCRAILASAFIFGAGACLRTAERLLRVTPGTVLAAREEMEARRG